VPPTHLFCDEIAWLGDTRISGGYADHTFRPAQPIERQAMAAFLHRFAGSPVAVPPSEPSFPDVAETDPFYEEIEWMRSKEITFGYADGTFRPTGTIDRQAMAAFLYRLAGQPAYTPPATPSFSDVGLDHPFRKEIEWLASVGVADGFPDGSYHPGAPVSRQAMGAFLHRLLPVLG
jgi:hypothetical protein